ncbi:hypothetical protein [uncultured Megasphaera sp.]|uniref:hypothetical protein n=1 Tax=uncultured Megasphaera sp. TaxID=165188 RepID=UPI00266C9DE2|nr:hypothetical protein [uncultured Megasphaera sp.]
MNQDIYKELPPILTAKDVAEFLRIGMNQAYDIVHEIGFRYGRTVRCTKNQLISFVEGGGKHENDENLRSWTDQAKA